MRTADPDLYKDKIEISLDGRQVFYLFFGGAVIACLVFVLGVMVGRRVEARAHVDRAPTSAARDPLAALDQLDATSRSELSFRSTLAGGAAETEVEQAVAAIEKARAEKKAEPVKPAVKAKDEEEPAAAEVAPVVEDKPAKPEKVADKPADKPAAKPAEKAEKAAEPVAKPDAEPAEAPEDKRRRFTLQLSSFKDKHEAEMFRDSMRDAGYRASISEAEVEGKGTFYRVRFGSYDSYDQALEAKAEFERKVSKIAYVTRI